MHQHGPCRPVVACCYRYYSMSTYVFMHMLTNRSILVTCPSSVTLTNSIKCVWAILAPIFLITCALIILHNAEVLRTSSFNDVLHIMLCNTLFSQDQLSPAHIAAYKGHLDILKTLHHNGAKLDTKDKVSLCVSIMFLLWYIMVWWYTWLRDWLVKYRMFECTCTTSESIINLMCHQDGVAHSMQNSFEWVTPSCVWLCLLLSKKNKCQRAMIHIH